MPKEDEKRLWNELKQQEEIHNMRYVSSLERISREEGVEEGEKKGVEKGEKKGTADLLFKLIQRRFGLVPDWAQAKMAEADVGTLRMWAKKIFDADKVESIFQ